MRATRSCLVALSLSFAVVLAAGSTAARAGDEDTGEPAGTVVDPGTITTAPTDEDAAAKAGGGFDTPADETQEPTGDDPEPKGTTAEPNQE